MINATLIYNKLVTNGFIKKGEASVCSVQRFIKKNDFKTGRQPNVKDRKAFEEEIPRCFALVLIGLPHINSILAKPVHEALAQRIVVNYNCLPFPCLQSDVLI